MTEVSEFIDAALQREASWERAEAQNQFATGLQYYGASVGAVRGAVRDAGRKYPDLTHDEVTALSSELWAVPVFERRLAAAVLLQSNPRLLTNSDLTRIEGFIREAHLAALVDPLAADVVGPLIQGLTGQERTRAESVLDRWKVDPERWLRRAALLAPLRTVRAGGGDWKSLVRRAHKETANDDDAATAQTGSAAAANWDR